MVHNKKIFFFLKKILTQTNVSQIQVCNVWLSKNFLFLFLAMLLGLWDFSDQGLNPCPSTESAKF